MKLDFLHQIVGRTRSGKTIICALSSAEISAVVNYFKKTYVTAEDFFDGYAVCEYLSLHGLSSINF